MSKRDLAPVALQDSADSQAWISSPQAYLERRPPQHQVDRPISSYVEMPDGCKLAMDVYLPGGNSANKHQRFCSLLVFTPYYRRFLVESGSDAEPSPNIALYRDFFVTRGYALVVVDVRGTGASFGSRDSFRSPRERDDSYHIADWVTKQKWSNQVIGATGISYLGAASDFLASTGHPAVKAIAPLFSVWDTYSDNYFPGGIALNALTRHYDVFTLGLDRDKRDQLRQYAQWSHPDLRGPAPVDDDTDLGQLHEALLAHAANFRQPEFMADIKVREEPLLNMPAFSSASISPYHYAEAVPKDVAILSVSGWADGAGYANGAISRFLTLSENPRHLLLGPWDHGGRVNMSPWRSADESTQTLFMSEALRFFDHYLLRAETGLDLEAPIHYYSVHAEAWQAATNWPPHNTTRTLHLGNGTLDLHAQATSDVVSHKADFSRGTGSHTRYERIASLNPRSYYNDWQGRTATMLSFDSSPLDEPLDLVGHAIVSLLFASSESDAAIHVYLTEVEEDGCERHVTEGLLRAVHRKESIAPKTYSTTWPFHSFRRQDAEPLVPECAERIRVPLLPVAWRFHAGSRLRLSIAGADADHCTLIPPGRPPIFRIHLGVHQDSFLELPIRQPGIGPTNSVESFKLNE